MIKRSKLPKISMNVAVTIFVFFLLTGLSRVYAQDPPSLPQAQIVIERIFNIVFASVAAVLVAVVAFGIWKSSLAAGDPRGLEGAKQTWSYAFYGFMVVVLFFAIFAIAQGILGIPVLTPRQLLANVFSAIDSLVSTGQSSGYVTGDGGGGGGGGGGTGWWRPPIYMD